MTDDDTCPVCGQRYLVDRHVELCRDSTWRGANTCPMCGERYDSYLDHLRECRAAE